VARCPLGKEPALTGKALDMRDGLVQERHQQQGVTEAEGLSPQRKMSWAPSLPTHRASSAGSSEVVQTLHTGPLQMRWLNTIQEGGTTPACMYGMTYAIVTLLAALALTQLVKIDRPL
jgi:hypothetical protein